MVSKRTISGKAYALFQASAVSLFLILAVLALTIGSSGAYASGTSASDTFSRSVTGGWGAADTGGTYALTGTSTDFSVDGSEGLMVLNGTGSTNQRVARLSGVSAMDVDETVRLAVSSLPTSTWHVVYLIARRVTSGNEYRARVRIDTVGGVHLQASVLSAGVESFLGTEVTVAGLVIAPGSFLNIHFQITGANPSTLLIRSWADGVAEPASWDYETTNSNSTTQAAGSVGIVSRAGSNVPVNFQYDDFVVMNSDVPAATATPTSILLNTATSTTAPTNTATPTRTVVNTATPTTAPASTATPTIASSNTPAATASPFEPTPTSTPVGAWSLTFAPQADAYVNASFPSNNYGTSTTLRVDGSPIAQAYIRFAPVNLYGAAITRARLRLYVNTASSVGIQVLTVSNNTWGETSITYSNAPPMGGALGSVSPISKGTWVTFNVTSHITAPGTYSVGVITSDTRIISLSARESGSHAPQLILDLVGGTPPTATPRPTATPVPPTPTPTNTPLPSTSTLTAAPTPTGSSNDPVVVGAGDIACGTSSTGAVCLQQGTANLILQINPAAVLPLGDNQYEQGSLSDFNSFYGPAWGAFKSITHPSVGNHEYLTTGAQGYFDYFNGVGSQTGPAGDRTKGYYSYNVGSWHLIVLNTDCSQAGGCSSGSPQETWLRADLSANAGKCLMAYSHFPMFSSGQQSHNSGVNPLFQDLYNAHGDVYLAGHDHDYERFYPSDPTAGITPGGVVQFVVGTGGRNMTSLSSNGLAANSAVFNSTTFGVIRFTLHATSYDWVFLPAASTSQFRNGTFTDSGSATCHLGK